MNVILVTVDCWRYDRCGFNGYYLNTTPVLDSIASESYIFDRAFATGGHTTESFPGILGGYHSFNGIIGPNQEAQGLPPDSTSIASHYSENGYQTIATLTNTNLNKKVNIDLGFDLFENIDIGNLATDHTDDDSIVEPPVSFGDVLGFFQQRMREKSSASIIKNPYILPFLAYRTIRNASDYPSTKGENVINHFINRLDSHFEENSPLFAWTHLMDLHSPLHPQTVQNGGLSVANSLRVARADSMRLTDISSKQYDRMYDSVVRYIDSQIGNLISYLREEGYWEETVLIVTADHGEALCDRGIYGHPVHYLFDELLHVPLLVRTPDDRDGRIKKLFSLAWLHELICDSTSIPRGNFVNSSGINNHIENNSETPIIADSLNKEGHSVVVRSEKSKYYKLASDLDQYWESSILGDSTWNWRTTGTYFQIGKDTKERIPQPGKRSPSEFRELAEKITTSIENLSSLSYTLNESVEDQLKQLGYVE